MAKKLQRARSASSIPETLLGVKVEREEITGEEATLRSGLKLKRSRKTNKPLPSSSADDLPPVQAATAVDETTPADTVAAFVAGAEMPTAEQLLDGQVPPIDATPSFGEAVMAASIDPATVVPPADKPSLMTRARKGMWSTISRMREGISGTAAANRNRFLDNMGWCRKNIGTFVEAGVEFILVTLHVGVWAITFAVTATAYALISSIALLLQDLYLAGVELCSAVASVFQRYGVKPAEPMLAPAC